MQVSCGCILTISKRWNDTMAKYIGKSFTIKEVMSRGTRVRLDMGDDTYLWMWHIDWISPVAEYTLF